MRVKIKDTWHDSKEEPICIQISEGEQEQIKNMDRRIAQNGKYAVFPDSDKMTRKQMLDFMEG